MGTKALHLHIGACKNPEDNAKLGIYLYRGALADDINVPERLEKTIGNSTHDLFKWSEAMVGYNEK